MKIYDGAMLHGVNRQNVAPGELGETISLDLGKIPEEIMEKEINPLIKQLSGILAEHKVYVWSSTGYHDFHEEDTENKDSE